MPTKPKEYWEVVVEKLQQQDRALASQRRGNALLERDLHDALYTAALAHRQQMEGFIRYGGQPSDADQQLIDATTNLENYYNGR